VRQIEGLPGWIGILKALIAEEQGREPEEVKEAILMNIEAPS
jgi:hypothetical protein